MRLSELIDGLPLTRLPGGPGEDPEVTGVAHDSRRAAPGDLFVAWRGARHDGAGFAPQAVAAGAVAVVAPAGAAVSGWGGEGAAVPWLTADDPHRLLGPLASRVYGHPDRELVLAGVTGTNGKSTVAALVAGCLELAGKPSGLLGSLGYRFGELVFAPGRTTPEASDLYAMLRAMRARGAEAASMEVSSHALALGRVEGAAFDVAIFTNLTRDHFDFHPDFEDYFATKRRLFGMLKPGGRGAVNLDDPWGARLAEELASRGEPPVTYGETAQAAMVRPVEVTLDLEGIRGTLATPRGELAFVSPLLGRFNLHNLLAAAAAAEALGLPHRAVAAAIAARGPLPGRMQRVVPAGGAAAPLPVFVDYAHTPAALETSLRSLRELAGGSVVLVFGCGGDRDPGKRPLMGRLAGELAELPIVTTDNPRSEDPLAIIRAVETGLRESGNPRYRVVPDRREAIHRAVAAAGERGWVVLIAGKGNEPVQLIGDRSVPFYDHDVAAEALAERYGQTVGS